MDPDRFEDLYDKLTLTIELGNAAMQTPEDVAEALERVATRIRQRDTGGRIYDLNGNAVGAFGLS